MVLIVQYSCVVVSVFGSGGKYTLLLYIPLLALTDRQTDRDSNTLASHGLEEPAHALHGLEELFFQLCCCVVSVFGSGGTCGNSLSGGWAIIITTGKKSSSCLSGGCAIVITTGKKKF